VLPVSKARPRRLVVRLDSMGDVLISGPAIRAVANGARSTALLTSPASSAAALLLPGVDRVLTWTCPWIVARPPAVERRATEQLIDRLRGEHFDEAVVLTSFHQSALPTALLLRWAGVAWIAAVSEDYPGSLLDVRIEPPADAPEPERMLAICRAAGYELPTGDDGGLRVALPPRPVDLGPTVPYVVVHPGAAADSRRYPAPLFRAVVEGLTRRGWHVVVTGSRYERSLTATVAAGSATPSLVDDLGGRLDLAGLAHLLREASAVVVGNTGPAHLAAAVGTPVVSLFSPVVPLQRWGPYTPHRIVLGDQHAACRGTRAVDCPIPLHPCLATVEPDTVVDAVTTLTQESPIPVASVR
jgi:ADP-heptose:LPS heptosyltransferase